MSQSEKLGKRNPVEVYILFGSHLTPPYLPSMNNNRKKDKNLAGADIDCNIFPSERDECNSFLNMRIYIASTK